MRLLPADVRHPLRRLAATPLLSLGAIVTLALGIGSAVVLVDIRTAWRAARSTQSPRAGVRQPALLTARSDPRIFNVDTWLP